MGRVKKNKLTLKDVKNTVESHLAILEMDFEDKKYGEKAKLLHKHYKGMLALLNAVGK